MQKKLINEPMYSASEDRQYKPNQVADATYKYPLEFDAGR